MSTFAQPVLTKTLIDQDGKRYILEADAQKTFAELTSRLQAAEEAIQYFIERCENGHNHPDGPIQSTRTYTRMKRAQRILLVGVEPVLQEMGEP
jgi:hypothetical protein